MTTDPTVKRRTVLLLAGVLAVLVVLPWIGGSWTSGSLFGFPVPAFLLLLLAPVLLVLLAGSGPWGDGPGDGEDGP